MIDCSKLKNTNQTGNETNRQEVVLIATGSFSPITFMHLRLLGIVKYLPLLHFILVILFVSLSFLYL